MTPTTTAKPALTPEQAEIQALKARIAQMEAEKAKKNTLSWKIGDKGGVSVYGLGRFPVTLYGEQWLRLFAVAEQITSFITANKDKLATKLNGKPAPQPSPTDAFFGKTA